MIIQKVKGNALEGSEQTITCTVNCVGVMGKGIAKAIKDKYPSVYKQYKKLYRERLLDLKTFHLITPEEDPDKRVLLFPTKDHWMMHSKKEQIVYMLEKLSKEWKEMGIESLAMVPVGCSNGGLEYGGKEGIGRYIEKYLDPIELPVRIYALVDEKGRSK